MRYALDVTRTAHKSAVKWVAPLIRLVGQLHTAILANVAVHMKVFVHRDHSDRFLGSLNRRDSLSTRRALRREHSVVIVYTIDLIVNVDREGYAIETLVADAAPEAARVIRFAHGLQYHFHDEVAANRAFLGRLLKTGIQVILLAIDPPMNVVEGFAAESPSAGTAYEAIGMIEIAHCLTCLSGAGHFLTTCMANAEILALFLLLFHFFFELSR